MKQSTMDGTFDTYLARVIKKSLGKELLPAQGKKKLLAQAARLGRPLEPIPFELGMKYGDWPWLDSPDHSQQFLRAMSIYTLEKALLRSKMIA